MILNLKVLSKNVALRDWDDWDIMTKLFGTSFHLVRLYLDGIFRYFESFTENCLISNFSTISKVQSKTSKSSSRWKSVFQL